MDFADAWERLRDHTLRESPDLGGRIAALAGADWRSVPPSERQVLLAAACSGSDPGIPATRRQLREAVRAALESGDPAGGARRTAPTAAALEAVASPGFAMALEKSPSQVGAVAVVMKAVKGIGITQATRFLALLGHPVIVIDAAKMRWMARTGLATGGAMTAARLREGLSRLAGLAASIQSPPAEFDAILAAFTEPTATCGRVAKCAACPMSNACPTGRQASTSPAGSEPHGAMTLAESMPVADRPREKLAARGAATLTDAELVAILLRTGSGRENAVALANRLMLEFGSLDRLSRASVAELSSRRGVGHVKAVTIKAALELARRLDALDTKSGLTVTTPGDIYPVLRKRFLGAVREEFVVVILNTRNVVMRIASVSEGILNQSLVHPREAFAEAVRDSAAAVIFAHNHPSGDPTPSRDDIAITERLAKAGDILGIRVLDHLIVGADEFYSFADSGRLRGGR